jgi:hypothetical protein
MTKYYRYNTVLKKLKRPKIIKFFFLILKNMTYSELLKTENWKLKREEILLRDNNTCRRCGISKENKFDGRIYLPNKNLETQFTVEFLHNKFLNTNVVHLKSKANSIDIYCKSEIYKSEIVENRQYCIIINFAPIDFIKYPFNGATINNLNDNFFLKSETNNFFNETLNKNHAHLNIEVDIEAIWLIEYGIEHLVSKSNFNLQVHHRCYREEIEIWEQQNNEYITLCNICHQIVHQNQIIPFYDINGNILQNLLTCKKCNGTGYLPQFNHYEGGTCFSCKGKGQM